METGKCLNKKNVSKDPPKSRHTTGGGVGGYFAAQGDKPCLHIGF